MSDDERFIVARCAGAQEKRENEEKKKKETREKEREREKKTIGNSFLQRISLFRLNPSVNGAKGDRARSRVGFLC